MAAKKRKTRKRRLIASARSLFREDRLAETHGSEAVDQAIWIAEVFSLRGEGALTSAGMLQVLEGYLKSEASANHDESIFRFLRLFEGLGYMESVAGKKALEFSVEFLYRYNRRAQKEKEAMLEKELGQFVVEVGG
ncbi:MAG: hypothetical protein QNJ07_17000 [Woeseiaceae bacterium]|nr:hypothetical protein [Woeseiaceae bacterium]